jgi:hypothetical protein
VGPSIAFFTGLLLLVLFIFLRTQRIEALQQHGVPVRAIITRVEQFAGITYVSANWQDPYSRRVYTFHNGAMFTQLPLQRGNSITVLVSRNNYKRYYMPLGARIR